MASIPANREAILEAIRGLSPKEQHDIAEEVAREYLYPAMPNEQPDEKVGWVSWRQLAGLFANDQRPPSDEEVEQWLDEARTEKYGG